MPNINDFDSVKRYYEKSKEAIFSFNRIEKDTILKTLLNIKTDKVAGIDGLTGRILKDGSTVLCEPITQISNLSIKFNIVPKKLLS